MTEHGSIEDQHAKLGILLPQLKEFVHKLPKTLTKGVPDGPLTRFFSNREVNDEGLYYTFNQAWDHAFQVPEDEQVKDVVCGDFGLALVYSFISYFLKLPRMEEYNGLHVVSEQVTSLISLIQKVCISTAYRG
jgi:hypothetical protein